MNIPATHTLLEIYGETKNSPARFQTLAQNFQAHFSSSQMEFFSAPGRTELIGNHTDHNGGKVIAASIDMDTIAAAFPNESRMIRIISEGYPDEIVVDLDAANSCRRLQDTTALTAGIMQAASSFGFSVGGFHAYISTDVINAAGVSSSASFEMLICCILNFFFNQNTMTCLDYAKIGQYAENRFWNKSSGLMDQLACAVGGTILMDFSDPENAVCKKLDFSFQQYGYELIIVNTGKGHADLGREYSDIPLEMKETASVLGAGHLGETSLEKLLENLPAITNDRAALRAFHFFEENRRVTEAVNAIQEGSMKPLLALMEESGHSSWEWLQNCYCPQNPKDQKISLTLALTRLFLRRIGTAAAPESTHGNKNCHGCFSCRVHGGGFAGVIMTVVPTAIAEEYIRYISAYVGKENVYPMKIRHTGAVHLN